jgi:hypothetical protein
MKKIILSFCLFLLFTTPAYAHILKTDGMIGAVLHVSPDDDPVAGEPTLFFFEFKDKQNKFTPQNCECTTHIIRQDKEIYYAPLFQGTNPSLDTASFTFTFPEKDIYKLQVTGKPRTADAFQPFTLEWDLRVARIANAGAQAPASTSHTFHYILFGAAFIVIGYFLLSKKFRD